MTDSSSNILLLAGEGELKRRVSLLLDGHGYHVESRDPATEALTSIKQHPPQLMICCLDPLGPLALECLRALKAADAASGFILMTGTPESEIAETAQHEGALLIAPSLPAAGQLLAMVRTTFELRKRLLEIRTLKENLHQLNLGQEKQITLLNKAEETLQRNALELEKARQQKADYAQELAAETTRRQGLERQLALSEEVRLLQAAALSREDERKRLSEELHDDIMTPLAAIGVDVGLLRRDTGNIPERAMEDLANLGAKIKDIDLHLRRLIWGIYPSVLTNLGLVPALRSYMEELSNKPIASPYSLEIELQTSGFGNGRLSEDVEIGLYRIVQHGVSNSIQHAQARKLHVGLAWVESGLSVQIMDDGVGFDVANLESMPPSGRLGLITLQDLVTRLRGALELESTGSAGTTIRVHIPAPPVKPGDSRVQTLKYVLGNGDVAKETHQDSNGGD